MCCRWQDADRFIACAVLFTALMCYAVQAAYDAAPMLPPEGAVKGPCLLGSLSFLVDDFDWGGETGAGAGAVDGAAEHSAVLC